ncbi:MAG: class I SAM-dependent methyltransferase, partial [Oscillospiraceae bacterium]|nr:class I SAM-dependent methyltransferase [Oscillospiraceae bacterium]
FDAVTAIQCFTYLDRERLYPNLLRMLKPNGVFIEATMSPLPEESEIAAESERFVKKYNSN